MLEEKSRGRSGPDGDGPFRARDHHGYLARTLGPTEGGEKAGREGCADEKGADVHQVAPLPIIGRLGKTRVAPASR